MTLSVASPAIGFSFVFSSASSSEKSFSSAPLKKVVSVSFEPIIIGTSAEISGATGGGASWRGAIIFTTATGKLAKLAGTVEVFEHSTDANDNVTSKLWEWK